MNPTAAASFHLSLKTIGSSSAPARNVSTIAPIPERNLIQDFVGAKYGGADGGADDQLSYRSDDNFG